VEERLKRTLLASCLVGLLGCGGNQPPNDAEPEEGQEERQSEALPLPTAGIAGQPVTVYPLTFLVTEETLKRSGWGEQVQSREEALHRADSLIAAFLIERAPEAEWVLPEQLRRAHRQAPNMLADPDKMGTSLLRGEFEQVPDPLRIQMRSLTGMVGEQWALVPASLIFFEESDGQGRAELTMVLVDVRRGRPVWRTVADGVGPDAWTATWNALKTLVPGLP
jgi:hypothetical protein